MIETVNSGRITKLRRRERIGTLRHTGQFVNATALEVAVECACMEW